MDGFTKNMIRGDILMEKEHFYFSLDERDRRWKEIREEMAKAEIDVMVIQGYEPSVRYIANTNWVIEMEHVIFPLAGDPVIILHGKDWKHINCDWIKNFELIDGTDDQIARIAKKFYNGNNVGYLRGSGQGVGNNYLQHHLYIQMQTAFQEKLIFADHLFVKVMQVASPEEQECLRRSAVICDMALHHVLESCTNAGTLDYAICADVMKIYYDNGNDGHQMLWIEPGADDNIGYGRPYGKRLAKGSSFVIEFAPGYNGYESEIVFSLPVDNKMSDFLREKYKIWQEAFYIGKEKLVVGNRACDVAHAIQNVYEKYGIGFRPDYGHGVGIGCCMGWGISTFDKTELRPNMPVVLHPKITDSNNQGVFSGMHYILKEDGLERIGGYNYEEFVDKMIKEW